MWILHAKGSGEPGLCFSVVEHQPVNQEDTV